MKAYTPVSHCHAESRVRREPTVPAADPAGETRAKEASG